MTALDDAPSRARRGHPVESYTDLDDVRQPPQDLVAEQSVLGGMMLSKDAIADVLERLRSTDFHRPNHRQIFDAILDLFDQGEPADAVTVAGELDRRGVLRKVGGAPYLHTLIAIVPTAANAGYCAGIVAEKAVLRRLVEAGTRVVQYGYAGAEGADIADAVDRAQAEVYAVTELLRLSREDELRCAAIYFETESTSKLPSVQHALSESAGMGADESASREKGTVRGDDDDSPEDFYADAWEDA